MKKKSYLIQGLAVLILAAAMGLIPVLPALAQGGGEASGDLLLSVKSGDDFTPAIAYNPAGQFLVVWRSGSQIYGQRYDEQGVPVADVLAIGDGGAGGTQDHPAVAYSLTADRYLVAWEDSRNGDDDIYGQLVDADGTPLGTNFIIYLGNGNQEYPDVASDGTDFLVVWQGNWVDDSVDVCGSKVFSTGVVVAAIGLGSDGGTSRERPAVAFNPSAGPLEYLVVFQYGDPYGGAIHARRVRTNFTTPGAEYTIVEQSMAQEPDLAATPWGATGAYVVVWSDFRNAGSSDTDIFGRVVLAGSDNAFDLGDFVISTAADLQIRPVIARLPTSGQFLVAWEDSRDDIDTGWDVYGRRLTDDANPLDAEFLVNDADGDQMMAAIAASESPDAYFVAWDTSPFGAGSYEINGQRVSPGGLLLWYPFAISAQPGEQSAPDAAFDADNDQYLAVWQDLRDGHWAIYGQRIGVDGLPLEAPWAIEADGHDNTDPVVEYSSEEDIFYAVWVDEDLDKLEGRQIPTAGHGTILISVFDSDGGRHPDLAYDAVVNRFLVVWDDGEDVYSRILQGSGFPWTGDSVVVGGGAGVQDYPAVATDIDQTRFLVVYQDGLEEEIWGQLVDYNGNPIGFDVPITDQGRYHPAVAYQTETLAEGLGGYLLVYEYWVGGVENDIRGRKLDDSGSPLGSELVIREEPDPVEKYGPQVAYARGAGLFSVIWQEQPETDLGYDLYGVWLDTGGSPASPVLPFFRYKGNQKNPHIGYDWKHQLGLVVWEDDRRAPGIDANARLGALDTTPPTAFFTRDPVVGREGDTFTFNAWPSNDNQTPKMALAVRWDWTSNGSWDTAWSVDNKYVEFPIVTQGIYSVTLQVRDLMWLTDVISMPVYVLPAGVNTPPTATLTVSPIIGAAGTSFSLDASASTDAQTPGALQFRWDYENDGVPNTIWSTSASTSYSDTEAGLHTVRVEVKDAGGLTDADVGAFLVLPSDLKTLQIDARSVKMYGGHTQLFRARAWDGYDNEMGNPPVTWSVTDPLAGAIDATGIFTAGVKPGLYPDAIMAESNGVTAAASVTIFWPYQVYLPLTLRGYP
jgi:hypothetical protein